MKFSKRSHGFTNIEKIILIFILILLVVIVLPNLFKTFEENKLVVLKNNLSLVKQVLTPYIDSIKDNKVQINDISIKNIFKNTKLQNPFSDFYILPKLGPTVDKSLNFKLSSLSNSPGDILIGYIIDQTDRYKPRSGKIKIDDSKDKLDYSGLYILIMGKQNQVYVLNYCNFKKDIKNLKIQWH